MILSAEKITEVMMSEGIASGVVCYDEIDSTNDEAKRLGAAGRRPPYVVTADRQTAGKGRLGRSFYSPSGTGVYESVVFTPEVGLESAVSITSAAAVAVCRAIEGVTGLSPQIKWVNDIYLNGAKVCGILAESFATPDGLAIVVGVGINVTTESFPEEIAARAGSIGGGQREEIIGRVAAGILKFAGEPAGAFIDEYRRRSMVLGREITFGVPGEEPRPARAVSIDDDGALIIELPDGSTEALRTGEISVRVN